MVSSPTDALGFQHVGQVLDAGQHAAQLGNILYLDHNAQIGQVFIDSHLHIHHIDTFTIQQGGDVTHQPLPVISADADGNRVCAHIFAPGNFYQPLPVLDAQHVGTILAVDGGAMPSGYVADDLIAWGRIAALAHAGQQAFQPEHGDSFRGNRITGWRDYYKNIVGLLGLHELVDHPANIHIAIAEGNI